MTAGRGGDGHWPLAFVVEIRPDPLILVFFATHTHSPREWAQTSI